MIDKNAFVFYYEAKRITEMREELLFTFGGTFKRGIKRQKNLPQLMFFLIYSSIDKL